MSRRTQGVVLLIVGVVVAVALVVIIVLAITPGPQRSSNPTTNLPACQQETALAREIFNDLGIEAANPYTPQQQAADQDLTGKQDQWDALANQCLSP